nr:MFS transporter [bacterium]
MPQPLSYKPTIRACYVGTFVQACVSNLAPVLFIPLRESFGLSYRQLGALILINFITQVACDLILSCVVDRVGFKKIVITAPVLSAVGFGLFAATPWLFPQHPYMGLMIATVIFAGAGGILELVLSPIIHAIPTQEKAAAMSLLHSCYAWGQVGLVLITTALLFVFSKSAWPYIVMGWALLPVVDFFLFLRAPMPSPVPQEKQQRAASVLKQGVLYIAFGAIALGGAAELVMSQWSSAFMERALGLPKWLGDTAGMCFFGLTMGIGRSLYGAKAGSIAVQRFMLRGALGAAACYAVVVFCGVPWVGLAACALCGLMVSLLWPGTLVLTAEKFPMAGAWLFAIMAAAGDIGASAGSSVAGAIADAAAAIAPPGLLMRLGLSAEQFGLRAGLCIGIVFSLGAALCVWALSRRGQAKNAKGQPAAPELPTEGENHAV